MTPRRATTIKRVYTFTVTGHGPFPIDMLRHDLCYPKSQSDAAKIEATYRRDRNTHHITLVSSKAPTEERWGSFGWAVESVE